MKTAAAALRRGPSLTVTAQRRDTVVPRAITVGVPQVSMLRPESVFTSVLFLRTGIILDGFLFFHRLCPNLSTLKNKIMYIYNSND